MTNATDDIEGKILDALRSGTMERQISYDFTWGTTDLFVPDINNLQQFEHIELKSAFNVLINRNLIFAEEIYRTGVADKIRYTLVAQDG